MREAQKIVNALLEGEPEPEEFIETRRRVRDQQRLTDVYFRSFPSHFGKPNVDDGQDISFTSGSRRFDREDGVWWETKRSKNPAYYALPRYFVLYPGPGKMAFIVVKMPRTVNTATWRSACAGIYRDATGHSWTNITGAKKRYISQERQQAGVDGADEVIYDKCLSGKMPQPAYEIFPDGSWKRTAN